LLTWDSLARERNGELSLGERPQMWKQVCHNKRALINLCLFTTHLLKADCPGVAQGAAGRHFQGHSCLFVCGGLAIGHFHHLIDENTAPLSYICHSDAPSSLQVHP
jgi:hypothetical protein